MTQEEKKYIDAKGDLLKALKSVNELSPQQREKMIKEIFGSEAVNTVCNAMQQRFR